MVSESGGGGRGGYQDDPDVVALHRVIGGYIERFSLLGFQMRSVMALYFAPPGELIPEASEPLLNILFANMTAKPIADAFFAMSTLVAGLDEGEVAVRNAIRRRVDEHVAFRNDLVHADWWVGLVDHETGESVPAYASKIKSESGVPTMGSLDLSTAGILHRIMDVQAVFRLVMKFGHACRRSQVGEGRVSDVLEAVPCSPAGGMVVREKRLHRGDA